MTIRELMQNNGENLGWCKPLFSEDESIVLAVNEGKIVGATVDGHDLTVEELDHVDIKTLAQRINGDYDFYSGWSDLQIATMAMHSKGCASCPWFGICDAMDGDAE